MPASADSRALATWLAAQDDVALRRILAVSGFSPVVGWHDFFDAAEGLMEPAAVARALAALPRPLADALTSAGDGPVAGEHRDGLIARGLVAPTGVPYSPVAAAVAAAASERVAPERPPAGAPETDAAAAERAFTAAAALADVLQAALATPLGRIGSGALGAADRRRLIDAGAVHDPLEADEMVALAARTGLTAAQDKEWLVTQAGLDWLHTSTVDRWSAVAGRLRDALPAALRTSDGGWIHPDEWPDAYPFDPAWPERALELRTLARRWAMIGPDGGSPSWASGLAAGGDSDATALRGMLPPEVDRVFLQNDLTAISPGPLEPQLDMRLRTMTVRESRAQASSYRFTADSIGAALTGGETAESLREFLTGLSLTGLPQPLAYEIERGATRHGLVRVRPDGESGRTVVASADPAALNTLAVDQALRPLGFVRDADGLLSRTGPETVFWMLADARYPVILLDAHGRPRTVDRHRLAETTDAPASDPHHDLVARLRTVHDTDSDAAWLGRELEQAVRARALLAVVVRLPDGSTREFTLEATGLGGGRLRGRDRGADIERTLPISSIQTVRAL